MIAVDVALDYPVLATPGFVVNEAPADVGPFKGGLLVDVGLWHVNTVTMGFSLGVRGWGATWERVPAFTAHVWDVDLDYGARFSPGRDEALVRGWYGIGTGLRYSNLVVDYWDDIVSYGLGAWTGGGAVIGRGPVRATVSVRASVSVRIDSWAGTVMASGETTTWTYWPGNARISALAGVAFR